MAIYCEQIEEDDTSRARDQADSLRGKKFGQENREHYRRIAVLVDELKYSGVSSCTQLSDWYKRNHEGCL